MEERKGITIVNLKTIQVFTTYVYESYYLESIFPKSLGVKLVVLSVNAYPKQC
jgi:hypothetical protein